MIGKIIMDLPPKIGNPRNSEGAMLRQRNGEILFVYSRFCEESDADNSGADIWAMRSTDEGEHFHDLGVVIDHNAVGAQNVMSVSLLRMYNGDLGLFYLQRNNEADMRMMLIRSSDDGKTWSDPVCCIPNPGHYVVNNDRVIRLKSGRIYIPAALHRRTVRDDGSVFFDGRAEFIGIYSDDDGATWRESAGKASISGLRQTRTGLQEPGILEIQAGILYGWARTDLGRQYETVSLDNGETWSAAEPSQFTGPVSPLSMKRLPDGRSLAIWNPVPLYNGRSDRIGKIWNGGRTPLCAGILNSNDLRTQKIIDIENDPMSGYCYVSIFAAKDGILLSYCAGGQEDGACLNRLRIRKIMYEELEQL